MNEERFGRFFVGLCFVWPADTRFFLKDFLVTLGTSTSRLFICQNPQITLVNIPMAF